MDDGAFASNVLPISSPSLSASLKVLPPPIKKGTSEEGSGERERMNIWLAQRCQVWLQHILPEAMEASKQKRSGVTPLRKH